MLVTLHVVDANHNVLGGKDKRMKILKFHKNLYSKIALIKAAYNFTDIAYVHLDSDDTHYLVTIENKSPDGNNSFTEDSFINEMLAQSVRHEVYLQTKNIRELLLARAMATTLIVNEELIEEQDSKDIFSEDEILKDWFEAHEKNESE